MSVAILNPRLCELGKIKIGRLSEREFTAKSGAKFHPPEKIDHFLVTGMQRDQGGNLIPDDTLMRALGESHGDEDGKLRQIPIALLSNDVEDVLTAAYVCYSGGKLVARCEDGKTLRKFWDPKTGEAFDPPQESPWREDMLSLKDGRGAPMFRQHTTLACVIAAADARWGGVYRFRTTSRISGDQLLGSLIHVAELTHGVLRGVPLTLVVRPVQVAPDGKKTTVYVVHVELHGPDLLAIQRHALDQRREEIQIAGELRSVDQQYRKMLTAWNDPEDEDAAAIEAEFHAPEAAPTAELTPDPSGSRLDTLSKKLETTPHSTSRPVRSAPPVQPAAASSSSNGSSAADDFGAF